MSEKKKSKKRPVTKPNGGAGGKSARKKKKKHFPWGKTIIMSFMCLLVALAAVIGYTIVSAPQISTLDAMPKGYRTSVLDDSGNVVLTLTGEASNRVYVKSSEIPDNLKNAFVAIEDERFYEHNGIDLQGIGRALVKGITTGSFSEGASTITQQLLKNNVFTDWTEEQTFLDRVERKLQEQYLALALESKVDKDWILENYLNTINLGAGNWGVETAARYYFNKDVSELSLAECATLAAITKNPTAYNPRENPEKNQERQQTVLTNMVEQGYISQEECQAAMNEDVYSEIAQVTASGSTQEIMTYFEDAMVYQILNDLIEQTGCSEEDAWNQIYKGGLTIYSTENSNLQNICQEEACDTNILQTDAEISMVIIDNESGQVKAMIGGKGEKTASLIMNRAISSQRQPGSTIKILAEYAAGIENGNYSTASTYDDAPYAYSDGTPIQNATETYGGKTTIQKAIIASNNIVALQCFQKTGMETIWNQLQKFGISTLTEADQVEALALGGTSGGVTNLEMTAAYSAIARGGQYVEPVYYTKVVDHDGNVLLEKEAQTSQAISSDTAGELTAAMEKVMTQGTGTNAAFDGMALAGKSGTTNDNVDAWFFGYSPYYTCGVWGGYDENQSQADASYVQELWRTVMSRGHESLEEKDFDTESGLKEYTICGKCGKLAKTGVCDSTVQGDVTETVYLPADQKPSGSCDCHVAVKICSDSGQKAGDHCPSSSVYTEVYLKQATSGTDDDGYTVPENLQNGSCQTHTSFWSGLFGNNSQSQNSSGQNSSGQDSQDNGYSQDGSYNESGNGSQNSSGQSDSSQNGSNDSSGGFWDNVWGDLFG